MTFALIAAFLLAYLLGSIPFGLLVARSQGVDIRTVGSGNIGATNVWRTMGRKFGLITFFCDFAKGLVAVIIARRFCAPMIALTPVGSPADHANWVGIAAAIGCILGHNFPIWLRFKGGKGVATSLGVIAGMMPLASFLILMVWIIVAKVTRYVSVASIVAALSLPIFVLLLLIFGYMHGWASFYFAIAATLLVIIRHVPNIRRLLSGTENRMGQKRAAVSEEGEGSTGAEDEEVKSRE